MSPDMPWGGAASDGAAASALANAVRAQVTPLVGVECTPFGRAGADAIQVVSPGWELFALVDGGVLETYTRSRAWASGRADLVHCLAIPRRSDEVQAWARRQAVNLVQIISMLEGGPRVDTRPLRLLLIDDEEVVLMTLERALGKHHMVFACTGPADGLELAKSVEPDGILCDLVMPEMDGLLFLETLRADRPELARRTCLMTAEPERLAGRTELAVAKPLSVADLDEVLRLFAVLRAPG